MQEIMQFIGNHLILSFLWIILLCAIICDLVQSKLYSINEISHSEVIQLINKEDAIIIDLRSRDAYLMGHIINSINLLAVDITNCNLGYINKSKSRPVIAICYNGRTSRKIAKKLNKDGFKRVYFLKEGIDGWIKENLPLVQK